MSDNLDMQRLLGLVSNLTQQVGALTKHQQQQEELLLRVQQPALPRPVPAEPEVRVFVVPDAAAQAPLPGPAQPAGDEFEAAPDARILPEAARPFQAIAYDKHDRLDIGEAAEYLRNPEMEDRQF